MNAATFIILAAASARVHEETLTFLRIEANHSVEISDLENVLHLVHLIPECSKRAN